MTTHVNDVGTWRQLVNIYVNDAAVWKEIQEVYVNDAGTWRSVFLNAIVSFFNDNILREGTAGVTATATFIADNDGRFHWNTTVSTDTTSAKQNWILPNSAGGANYNVRATVVSGAFTTGTTGTFLSLGTDRTWTVSRTAAGNSSCTFTIEIQSAGTGVVLDTATFSLTVDLI